MTREVLAELRRLTAIRAAWVVAGMAAAVTVASALAAAGGSGPAIGAAVVGRLAVVVPIVGLPVAALVVTEEYRSETVWLSFAAVPQRWRIPVAKALLVAPVAAAGTAAAALVAVGPAGLAGVAARCALLGLVVAVSGIAAGALVRHGATAVAVLLVWAALLERLLSGLPEIGPLLAPLLPLANLRFAVTGADEGIAFWWPPAGAAIYVCVAAGALFVSGLVAAERVQP